MDINSYTDRFTGDPVLPSPVSYVKFNLTGSISLNWPSQFLDNGNVVAGTISVSVNNNGYSVTLPDARAASIGQPIIFINSSGANFSFTIRDNAGGFLATINQGVAFSFVLTDTTTAAGSWLIFPYAQGATTVTSVAATTTSSGLNITGSPITSAGTLTFNLASSLNSLANLNSVGILVQSATGPSTIKSVSIIGGINIDAVNGDGVLGDPTLNLSDNVLGLSSLEVGTLNLSNNMISAVPPNTSIQISPTGTGAILLGNGLTPPTITSTGNITNVVDITASGITTSNQIVGTTSGLFSNVSITNSNITTTTASNFSINSNGAATLILQSASTHPWIISRTAGVVTHPSAITGWVKFDAGGTVTGTSYNTTSVAKTGTGQYTVTFDATIFSTTLVPFINSNGTNGIISNAAATNPNQVIVTCRSDATTFVDPNFVYVYAIKV